MDNSVKTQQNVVSMSNYQPHSGYAPLSLVEAYWEALRAGREMPKRAEIDPRGIESALEYAFILERVAPGVARMRIAGSHLTDLMGIEARGMPLTAFFEQDARLRVAGLLEEVFQTPATAEVMMHSRSSLGQPEMEARMILLPLKSDLGDVSRILGCFVAVGERGSVPRRFDLRNINLRSLRNSGAPQPAAPATPALAFEEPGTPFVPAPKRRQPTEGAAACTTGAKENGTKETGCTKKARPPYLRLVKSDK